MPRCLLRNTNNLEGKVFHMEFEHIIELINAVSKSNLSTFTLEEGNMKITLGTKQPEIITKSFEVQNNTTGEYKVIQQGLPAEEAVRPSFRGWIANGSAWAADARIFSLLRMMKWLIVSRLPRGSCALSSREISVPETIVS